MSEEAQSPLEGPRLTITRDGLVIDVTNATKMTGEYTWEQIDRWRAIVAGD